MVIHRRETGLDKLGIIEDGIYCIFPFSELDNKHKGIFKIGIATSGSFYNRLENNYTTYFPMGFYYKSFLEKPTKKRGGRTTLVYYREIEKFIFDNIKAKKIISNARVNLGGKTEWVYSNQKEIDDVFELAYKKYGGKLNNYKLTKAVFDEETEGERVITTATIKFV